MQSFYLEELKNWSKNTYLFVVYFNCDKNENDYLFW